LGVVFVLVFSNSVENNLTQYKLPKNTEVLFIGDSHLEQAIDDNLLKNSINLGASSESFYYSYYKLKSILDKPNAIKTVYLNIGYHSLSNYYNRFIYGDESVAISSNYFFLLPIKEQAKLIYHNRNKLASLTKTVIKQGVAIIKDPTTANFHGCFNNTFSETKANIANMNDRLDYQFYKQTKTLYRHSTTNETALHDIITLCNNKNIELIALSTPIHKYFYNKIPPFFKNKFKETVQKTNLKLIDLSHIQLQEDDYLPDGDHVSKKGAGKTTLFLKNLIESN
jgi:hypothetical protein